MEGKIYKIVNDDIPDKVYYGSTIQPLCKRYYTHRTTTNCTSNELFKIGKPKIILVENYPCETLEDLRQREQYYILNNKCVNKLVPRNKEQAKEHRRQYTTAYSGYYYEKNKERLNKKEECIYCKKLMNKRNKARHYKICSIKNIN